MQATASGTYVALATLGTYPEVHSLLLIMLNNYSLPIKWVAIIKDCINMD